MLTFTAILSVSIHAPVKGRLDVFTKSIDVNRFQSTPP